MFYLIEFLISIVSKNIINKLIVNFTCGAFVFVHLLTLQKRNFVGLYNFCLALIYGSNLEQLY